MKRSTPRARGRLLALVGIAALVVVTIDQVTKTIALDALDDGPVDVFWTLRFALSFNSGVAFSMGSGLTPLITVAALALVGALLLFARTVASRLVAVGLGLLLGGAIGNLADRLFRGHDGAVVDFIDLQWWPVFNVADIGVSVGAVLLIVSTIVDEVRARA